jgi:group I intron endonuclease
MIIYKITNKINSKVYIGQTVQSLEKRWRQHCCKKKHSILYQAIQKYGKENFKVEEIDGANSLSELNYLEEHYIHINNCIASNGYNILPGGRNSLHTEETKTKMRKPKDFGDRTDFSYRKHSEETKKKLRDMKINNPLEFTEEHRRKISENNKGKKHSDESKNKISLSKLRHTYNKGRKYSKRNSASIKIIAINVITKEKIIFNSILDASKFLLINTGSISNILSGRGKQTKDWTFKKI